MDDGIRRINCVFTSTAQTGKREAPFGGSTAAFGRSGAVPRPAQARVHRFSPPGAGRTGLFALLIACVAAFSLFFALELTRSDIGAEAFAALRASAGTADNAGAGNDGGTEQSRDDRPGRLHLVELPGMLTVFAPSDSPILPLPFERFELGDDLTVGIYAPAGTEVFSVLSGTVRSVTDSGVTVAC
ncbi:MAG: hypothetical protein IK064_00995, partial [Clostridia bacterium]|nr:hypothetical protein [Clostridia bacterium]